LLPSVGAELTVRDGGGWKKGKGKQRVKTLGSSRGGALGVSM
jgi:hypothetical protein